MNTDNLKATAQATAQELKATAQVKAGEAKEYFQAAAAESDKKTFKAMGLGAAFAIAAVGLVNAGIVIGGAAHSAVQSTTQSVSESVSRRSQKEIDKALCDPLFRASMEEYFACMTLGARNYYR